MIAECPVCGSTYKCDIHNDQNYKKYYEVYCVGTTSTYVHKRSGGKRSPRIKNFDEYHKQHYEVGSRYFRNYHPATKMKKHYGVQ